MKEETGSALYLATARPLAALRVRASRSGNPTPSAQANLARALDLRSARLPSASLRLARRVGCPSLAFDCASIRPRRGRSPFKVCPSAVDVW